MRHGRINSIYHVAYATRKVFVSKGILEEISGKKIERGVIAVPAEQKEKILEFIKKNGIKHKIIEIWAERL